MLIELLPPSQQQLLHSSQTRMLTQWPEPLQKGEALWHIRVLEDELAELLVSLLSQCHSLYCRHIHQKLAVHIDLIQPCTPEQMIEEAFSRQAKGVRLRFRTPTSHKVRGQYVNLPSVELIGKSIVRRMASITPDFLPVEEEVLDQVLGACYLSCYQLQSVTYQLEGHFVPAYQGWMDIGFRGSEDENHLADALFSLADFTGIGIKTTLGMGGCQSSAILS